MTEWLIQQQGVLSLVLAYLLISEKFLAGRVHAHRAYQAWILVPLCLAIHNLPGVWASLPPLPITRYTVGLAPQVATSPAGILFGVWLTGALTLCAYALWYHWQLQQPGADKQISSPMLVGVLSPRIMLPASFTRHYSPAQQALILEHEHTHLRHRDHWWNALALCLAALFWFNPLVWLALRSFRLQQELACDAAVLTGKPRQQHILYAEALVQCAQHASTHPTLYPTLGDKSTMIKRLNQINRPARSTRVAMLATAVAASVLTLNTALAKLPAEPEAGKINQATPVQRVDPMYPKAAADKGVEGSVVLQFDISQTGSPENIKVVKSNPAGVFDDSAKAALAQWVYKPRVVGGQAQRQQALLVQLDFLLGPPAPEQADK